MKNWHKFSLITAAFVLIGGLALVSLPMDAQSTTTTPALQGTNVPAADSTANNVTADVIGNKADAAAVGAVSTTESLMAYAKQNVTAAITNDANIDAILVDTGTTIPATIATAQADLDIITGASGVNLLTATQASIDAIETDTAAMQPVQEMAVSKTITTVMNGNNDLFVVAGGPIKIIEIVAYVTTEIEGKSCLINYNIDPTTPATDTAFATDGTALEINADAVGTLYTWDGVIANDLTATTNGVALGVAAYSGLIVPAGSIELAAVVATSATGAITVYMRYIPLSASSTVTDAS